MVRFSCFLIALSLMFGFTTKPNHPFEDTSYGWSSNEDVKAFFDGKKNRLVGYDQMIDARL